MNATDLTADEHLDDVEAWHAARIARLTAADGWLSLAGLHWLHDGANSVGVGPDVDVRLPDGPPALGTLDVSAGGVVARLDATAAPAIDGSPAPASVELASDAGGARPTLVRVGRVSFHLIERAGRVAVRVRDPDAPARRAFTRIERYPVDARWRVVARFSPHPSGAAVTVPDVLGTTQAYANPGVLAFDLDGVACSLEAFREPDEDELFLVFGDETNHDETYGGGRYLYAHAPDEADRVVLDFNRAYNPPCAFTPFATCVLPPDRNRLPVRVEAGERRYEGPTS